MHDTFLAADFGHPGDNIPPILAVAQAAGKSGKDLIRGIATAYEIQINLIRSICLHEHHIDHIAHLCPAQAAGIGALLDLPVETIYQAIQQAVHVSFTTRQSRKGEISSWKAFAPAHAGKLAIEAVDRAMRGENSPSPIYEGEESVIATMLGGAKSEYSVPLPAPGEPKRAILDSYTKEHSAEYQAQALIDLAFRMRAKIADLSQIEKVVIHTSHHTHQVIGTGANDPQKMDPLASRETLDHSVMYIFAVALEDGGWHHVESYAPERAGRPGTVRLWRSIETREDPEWTRRYHSSDPAEKAFGGRVEIFLRDGRRITDEIRVANAHPLGAKPFGREDYQRKFQSLTDGILSAAGVAKISRCGSKSCLRCAPENSAASISPSRRKRLFKAGRACSETKMFAAILWNTETDSKRRRLRNVKHDHDGTNNDRPSGSRDQRAAGPSPRDAIHLAACPASLARRLF